MTPNSPLRDLNLPAELTYVKVVPGYECTKGCFYCYNKLLNQRMPGFAPDIICQLKAVLEQASQPVVVELIGGEPLEEPALPITVAVLKMLQTHAMCAGTVLSTAVISSDTLAGIMPMVNRVYLSVDIGRGNRNRKHVSVDSLRRITALARDADVDLATSTVLFGDETFDDFAQFLNQLVDIGVPSAGFGHITAMRLSDKDVAVAVRQYYELFQLRLALRPAIKVVGGVLDSLEIHLRGGTRRAACECGTNSVSIEPNGRLNVGLCFDHSTQTYDTHGFAELRAKRSNKLQEDLCGTCELWAVCQGGCTSEAIRLTGSPYGRALTHCAVLRGLFAYVLADLNTQGTQSLS
jgi:radical SAM protein with 4Fe4S-binding SPASM domain